MRRPLHRIWPALLIGLATAAFAEGDPAAIKNERARLTRERAAAEARFDAERRDCEQRFVVTACLDRAKAQRRATLDELARQRTVLDDIQRRERAAARQREVEKRQREAEVRATSAPGLSTVVRPPREPAARPARASSAVIADRRLEAAGQEAANREDHERRLREAQAHREAVERRNAERAARRPSAAAGLADQPPGTKPASK
jgi:hypothetical protein